MNDLLISNLKQLLREVYLDCLSTPPQYAIRAFKQALAEETSELAKLNLKTLLANYTVATRNRVPACSDTGNPIWYLILGSEALPFLKGGVPALERLICQITSELTHEGLIQIIMHHPLREEIRDNVGERIPEINYKFREADYVEFIATPKGVGTEEFGSRFEVVPTGEGVKGIKRFVMDSVIKSVRHGTTCPPNIVGVGIGGTFDLCPRLAMEAALLRPIGDRHPDPQIASLEQELLAAINATGIGPLGMGGQCTALDVHIETAFCDGGIPTAVTVLCPAIHLGVVRLYRDGRMEKRDQSSWFEVRP